MAKINFKITLFVVWTLIGCSNKTATHAEAVNYFKVIKQTNINENKLFDEFKAASKKSSRIAQESSPHKLDSLNLNNLQLAYKNMLICLDSDIVKLNHLREVDNDINLKSNFLKNVFFVDSLLKKMMPGVLKLLKNGLETMTDEDVKQYQKFKEATDREQKQRSKNDQLSHQFATKYDILGEELTK